MEIKKTTTHTTEFRVDEKAVHQAVKEYLQRQGIVIPPGREQFSYYDTGVYGVVAKFTVYG